MGVGDSLRCLTSIVQQLEETEIAVAGVETRAGADELDCGLSLELDFFTDAAHSEDVSLSVDAVSVGDDGTATFDVSVQIDGDTPAGELGTTTHSGSNDAQPAYKDPERLRSVYESYDTFPAMTEALGVEVTPKTVRNHMVKHGIHDPEENKSEPVAKEAATGGRAAEQVAESESSDEDTERVDVSENGSEVTDVSNAENGTSSRENGSEEGQLLSDGHGMPDDLTLDDIKEGVRSAATLTEFSYQLDIDYDRARVLLENLNLVDLVYGRVADGPNRDVPMEDIENRIRSAVGTPA